MARPNFTFGALLIATAALIAIVGWSTHHLLLAGAPAFAAGGAWPSFSCLLLPLDDDFMPHLASYAFLLAIAMGAVSGGRMLLYQHQHTTLLLQSLLPARSIPDRRLERAVCRTGLGGRLDVVELDTPVAFSYGCLRPRVLVSTGLIELLLPSELEALLLHEREHVRQRDPLKVAVGKLLASTVFFAPLISGLYRRYLVEKELAADRAAVLEQGSAEHLSAALLQLLDHRQLPAPAAGAGAGEALSARVDALLGEPVRLGLQLEPAKLAWSALVVSMAVVTLLAAPLPVDSVASNHNIVSGCHIGESQQP